MRLQQLEIKGFKSFAEHTIINFNEDITGIVGPNGSGKSNLVDAIRWVLGEQKTKDLRTEKMENVIFNGTKKRKKSGRAFVGLNFINDRGKLPSEYHEIVISRTLYRSGESEYRLNNTKCRLKDIKNLFLDTGIGSDSYAIISLGMVDEILLDRENFRRRMLEQAAGIEKYRVRKRKTMLKLDKTEEDLDRLLDLLHEVEINMKSLKTQANRARKYKDIKEQYKLASLLFTKRHLSRIDKDLGETKKLYDDSSRELLKLKSGAAQLEKDIEQQKFELLSEEKGMGAHQEKLNALMNKIRENETQKSILKERNSLLTRQKDQSEQQLQAGDEELEKINSSKKSFESKLDIEQKVLDKVSEELKALDSKREQYRVKLSELTKALREIVEGEQEESEALKSDQLKRALIEERMLNIERSTEDFKKDIQAEEKNKADLSEKTKSSQSSLEGIAKQIEDLDKKKTESSKSFEALNNKIEDKRKKINKLNRRISGLESELNITTSMVENLEGYPEAVKTLSKNKKLKGDFELFSDIINIEEKYKAGLELFLSNYINSLVSKNVKSAFTAVQLLRDSQGGKVDIIFNGASTEIEWKKFETENAVKVLDILDYNKKYKNIIEHTFANVYIVEQLPDPQTVENGIVLIEASGERILSAGRLRGGSKGLFEGKKLGRKKNIALLEKNLNKLNDEVYTLNTELDELIKKRNQTNLNEFDDQFDTLLKRRQELHSTLAVDEEKILRLQQGIETKTGLIKKQTEERKQLIEEGKELDKKIKLLSSKGSEREDQIVGMREEIQAQTQVRDVKEKEYNEKNISFLRQENLVQSIRREIDTLQKSEEDHYKRLDIARNTLESNEKEIARINKDLLGIDEFLEANYKLKNAMSESLNKEEREYYKKKEAIAKLEKLSRENNTSSQRITEKLSTLESSRQRLGFEKKEYLNRLEIEFEAEVIRELNDIEDVEDKNEEELRNTMEKYKSRLRTYGEINPLAIETYEEVKKRYDELVTQRDDIVNAKTSLLSTIDEIEHEAEERFSVTFEDVRVNFKKVFRSLFTHEDECDLYLEDEDDQLNSKIKIIARPKGKRPQSINQLSGGEKALTSTAFLFALYLLKPAPFCIFDEVDAPLDDQNILKFNKIIKEFSSESQFIIITHNKLSMSNVDIIYGITMGEEGVSQISGVDFRKLKNPAISA